MYFHCLYTFLKRECFDMYQQVFCDSTDIIPGTWPAAMRIQKINDESQFQMFIAQHFEIYESIYGCILFTVSLLLTRGINNIAEDMDDSTNGLIGNYGHCNQELVNLLLTGRASSNVFDSTKPLGDSGMVLKGVLERSDIGYLTHLESMRYCQVGTYYKVPRFPIWVVGSSSHFTVLFSLNMLVNAETSEEKLLSRVKREFRNADIEENGYISMDRLDDILRALDIDMSSMSVEDMNSVKLLLDPESCGIILWGAFWVVLSRLMSGSSIVQLVDQFSSGTASAGNDNSTAAVNATDKPGEIKRSDSDLARALQEEWNSANSESTPMSIVPDAGSTVPSHTPGNITRSDSDLARALQEEWNSGTPETAPSCTTEQRGSKGSLDIASIVSSVSASVGSAVERVAPPVHTPQADTKSVRADISRHDRYFDVKGCSILLLNFCSN